MCLYDAEPHVESSDSIAIAALNFLAADSKRLAHFLFMTGLGPHNLRKAAGQPNFLRSVLEYIAADEQLLLAFAAEAQLKPAVIARAVANMQLGRTGDS